MRFRTFNYAVLSLVLLSRAVTGQVVPSFTPTGDMNSPRSNHTATLLADGRVLIAGGSTGIETLASAELYDPGTGSFVPTGNMTVPRRMHSATGLPDGRVLIAGGWGLTSAELYDPATGTFTPTGDLLEDQGNHSATLLPNGTVLIAGGQREARPWPTAARAEIYDVETGTFSFAGNYASVGTLFPGSGGPIWPTANLLPDGRVLIVSQNPPEIYDPGTNTFSLTGAMLSNEYRYGMYWQNATTLRDGTVLVTGGNDDWTCTGFFNAELYDPSSGTFRVAARMIVPREAHTGTLLHDGNVLLTGGGAGWCGAPTARSAELYVAERGSFVDGGMMTQSRAFHTATLLNDGSVLIAGGLSYWPYTTRRSAELYRPATAGKRRAVHRR